MNLVRAAGNLHGLKRDVRAEQRRGLIVNLRVPIVVIRLCDDDERRLGGFNRDIQGVIKEFVFENFRGGLVGNRDE